MFRYEYPEFKNKHLLNVEMLEQLRDYPRYSMQLLFQNYGNGIINGCELSWNDHWLTVDRGVIYWNGNLYFMENPYKLECRPEDQMRYLVVKFLKEKRQSDKVSGETGIYLRKEPVRTQDEMELCRFRLQEGSRLRSIYKDFRDFSTEYDTINIIHAPYAGEAGSVISPEILIQFAEEMLETDMDDMFDVSFVMNVLANNGCMSRKIINQYIKKYFRTDIIPNNDDLYQKLLKKLSKRKHQSKTESQNEVIQKRIMLM